MIYDLLIKNYRSQWHNLFYKNYEVVFVIAAKAAIGLITTREARHSRITNHE